MTTSWTYNLAGQPLTESYSGGTLSGYSVSRTNDNAMRVGRVQLKQGATVLGGARYGYDTAGRLQAVTNDLAAGQVARYGYDANSVLVKTVTFTNGAGGGLVTTKAYDKLNRLGTISSRAYGASSPGVVAGFDYQYNAANQRTRAQLADGSYWVYQYDELGQVTSGRRYWADGTDMAGQQFDYAFDDIGNRTASGGRASAVSAYTRNYLNQYTQRTVAGTVDVLGVANPGANVTVNGNMASRKGEYFHYPLSVANATAQYPAITTISQYGTDATNTGRVYVAPSNEVFQCDADGNLTSDGRWTYT